MESKITIYSESAHIIHKLSSRTQSIVLSKSVDISSIFAMDISGNIIPFVYVPESNFVLTNQTTGEKNSAAVYKGSSIIEGKLLTLTDDTVTILDERNITSIINKYDIIEVQSDKDYTRPQIILKSLRDFTLSYLISNISWKCIGTALMSDKTMFLRLSASITNTTESDLSGETILCSGEIYQKRPQSEYKMIRASAQMMSVESPTDNVVTTSLLEDYTKYNLGYQVIRNKGVAEIGAWNIPIVKVYIHDTRYKEVKFGYRFKAPVFIPVSDINVYSEQNGIIDSYLGYDSIRESQPNEDVNIIIGETTRLMCKTLVIVNDQLADDALSKKYNTSKETHLITEDITVEITNRVLTESFLIIKHYVGNKILMEHKCKQYTKRENGFVEWYFQIAPGGVNNPHREEFKCQISTLQVY